MFTKRISAYLAASGLALGGLLAVAGPAAASTGPGVSTLSQAGYQATNRDFRFAQATIQVPDRFAGSKAPMEYVALESGDSDAGAGIVSCQVAKSFGSTSCTNGTWLAFAGTFNNTLGGINYNFVPLPGVNPGDGVFFSVYYNVGGDSLHYVITTPGVGGVNPTPAHTYYFTESAQGAVYNEAVALDDWTFSGTPSISLIGHEVNTFSNGRFTTARGTQGSFQGPWTLSPVVLTSNGLAPPSGTEVVSPTGLGTTSPTFKGLPGNTFSIEWGGNAS